MTQEQFNTLSNELKQYGSIDWKEARWASPITRYMTIIPKDRSDKNMDALKKELSDSYPNLRFSIGESICNNIIKAAINFYVDVKN